MPCFVLGPGVVPGESDALVQVTDIFATVMELTGEGTQPQDSVSFADVLFDPGHPGHRGFLYAEKFDDQDGPMVDLEFALRNQRYKWLNGEEGEYLFDLETDPFELTNLISNPAYQGILARLQAMRPQF